MQADTPPDNAIQPVAFLSLGMGERKLPTPHFLARVDAAFLPELAALAWRVTPTGWVYRSFYDPLNTAAEGRKVVCTEALGRRLLGLRGYAPWSVRNGDTLDLRLCNLYPGTEGSPAVEPGSSFRDLPEYPEAVRLRALTLADPELRPSFARKARLSRSDVRRFLDTVQSDPALRGCTLQTLREYLATEFRDSGGAPVLISLAQITAIVSGKSLHVPGYDYGAIARSRPSRIEIALRREAVRRDGKSQTV